MDVQGLSYYAAFTGPEPLCGCEARGGAESCQGCAAHMLGGRGVASRCPAGDSPARPPTLGRTGAQLRHCCQGSLLPLYHFLPFPSSFTTTVEREEADL